MSRWMRVMLASTVSIVLVVPSVAVAQESKGDRQRPRELARHRKVHCAGPHVGLVGRHVIHAELKVQSKDGFVELKVDAGKLTVADPDALSLKRADGETVSAQRSESTKVCRDGKKVGFEALRTGDLARIVIKKDATLIAVVARSERRKRG